MRGSVEVSKTNNPAHLAAPTLPDTPITYDVMDRLFDDQKIMRREHKKPNAAALAPLGKCAESLRKECLITPLAISAARKTYSALIGMQFAGKDLRSAVNAYDQIERVYCDLDGVSATRETAEMDASRERFRLLAGSARTLLAKFDSVKGVFDVPGVEDIRGQLSDPTKPPVSWHKITGRLVLEFLTAVRSTNPNLELKVSNDGPIARFVAAITPLITGETPNRNAVARWIQRDGDKDE